jgi:hypothetical protein
MAFLHMRRNWPHKFANNDIRQDGRAVRTLLVTKKHLMSLVLSLSLPLPPWFREGRPSRVNRAFSAAVDTGSAQEVRQTQEVFR